jgi:hypothetical protein
MALCNPATISKENYRKEMSKLYDYWALKDAIADRFTYKHTGYNREASAKNLKWFFEQKMELPFDSDLPLTKAQLKKMKLYIDEFDTALKGKFSNLAWVVPEGISKQDPTSRRFYLRLNDILNFERVNINKVTTMNTEIANDMFDAFVAEHNIPGMRTRFAKDPAMTKLREIREKMAKADASEATMNDFVSRMKDLIESNEGKTIKQYHELIHMSTDEFKAARRKDYRNEAGELVDYNAKVYSAVEKSRIMLDDVGGIYLKGLTQLKQIVALKYSNTSNLNEAMARNPIVRRFVETIDQSIKDIEKGIEKGGYFPQIEFQNMMTIKENLSKAMTANKFQNDFEFTNLVDNILSKMNVGSIPHHAQKRNPKLQKYWEKDPMMVLKEYGDQAVQFNKLLFTQKAYLEALGNLPKSDTQFAKGMERFINEEYAVFTKGTGERALWANRAVTTLNAFQTARTMGLNITGAVKNGASAINYYSRVGFTAIRDARKSMNNSKGQEEGFDSMVRDVEKEAGFLFQDVAQELYTEGLVTADQFKTGEIEFNPVTGKINFQGNPIRDSFVKGSMWTLDKALFFHRLTENHQRKWMFRTSFHQKYNQLIDQGYDKGRAKEFSKNFALKMVNGWAYEYAAHAKPKLLRGEFRTVDEMEDGTISSKLKGVAGAGSEVAFHLLHYPLSLMESQWSTMKGAHKGLLAGEGFASEDVTHIMRYAGMMSLIGLVSAGTNIDFTNILENETYERMSRVLDDLHQYDNPEKGTFGLMSEFTGPTLGMLKYGGIMGGIIDIDNNDLNKIMFGNVDFSDPNDRQTELFNAYQYSTFWGTAKNKILPALESGRGRDLVTHYLKLYPSKWTKEGHEMIWGKRPSKKKAPKNPTDVDRALKVLDALDKMR